MTISAQSFKDNYVEKLIDEELANRLGLERTQLASIHYNLDSGNQINIDDGIPMVTITKGGKTKGGMVDEIEYYTGVSHPNFSAEFKNNPKSSALKRHERVN